MTGLDYLRWGVAVPLALFFIWVAIANGLAALRMRRLQRENMPVPYAGGLCGCIAMLLIPAPNLDLWAWLPAVLDAGCIPLALARRLIRPGARGAP
jgi:hypothetical protein